MIKVPLIGSDLRFDEVPIRAIKIFEYFDHAVDQIFNTIDARIDKNMTRISDINARLAKASEKIEKLKTSKKAIRMFSPARYPVEVPMKFKPTFDSTFQPGDIDLHYKLDLPMERTDYKQYGDKLQFFHLKSPKKEVPKQPDLISNITSISSLITFVNNENLYLKDSLKTKESQQQPVEQAVDDDTTDFSRFSTMIRTKQHGDNFHYLPSFNQAPEFEFPLDLPDLDGIAGDISFSVPDEELIEPTFRTMNIVNDLPNVAELMETKKIENPAAIQPPSIPADLPLPPPPPPPPIPQMLVPPPPPPPMPLNIQSSAPPAPPVPQVDDARSSLMKAIRDAAGKAKAKMKTVPAADEQSPEVKKPKQQPPAMDFISDLNQKLLLRRKGIAGSKQAKKEKSSMMARVSALIPPPPKKPPSSDDSDDSDSDGNDDDDWE
ncbi:WASH complex subunit 1-like [Chironomus tepperi]|uniref:WASH complex subunit 1-like n=1 Tax=Chironomus tepperi TaxID=113505 RepID=UPI00391F57AD